MPSVHHAPNQTKSKAACSQCSIFPTTTTGQLGGPQRSPCPVASVYHTIPCHHISCHHYSFPCLVPHTFVAYHTIYHTISNRHPHKLISQPLQVHQLWIIFAFEVSLTLPLSPFHRSPIRGLLPKYYCRTTHTLLITGLSCPLSPRIRPIQPRNLPRDPCPLQLPPRLLAPSLLHQLIPLHELIHEPQMWLDDDIQSSRSNKAVSFRKRHALTLHHLSDADCCRSAYANTAVDQCCASIIFAAACERLAGS